MTHEAIAPTLPHSEEAERGILGAFLAGNQKTRAYVSRLAPKDFYILKHQRIFAAVQKLDETNTPIDLLAIHEYFLRTGGIDEAGGIAGIAQMVDGVPRVANLEFYARTIKARASRRALITAAYGIYKDAFASGDTEEALLDRGIEQLSQIARDLEVDRDNGANYRDTAISLLEEFDSQDGGVRIYTGVDALDRLTGGFRAGELVTLTAETGVGKTLLAQQTRRESCRTGRHTLFCSGEMMARHLIGRELATEAVVEHWKMRRPERITPDERRALIAAATHECQLCRILDGELSVARIRRVARQMKSQKGLDLVIVDYMMPSRFARLKITLIRALQWRRVMRPIPCSRWMMQRYRRAPRPRNQPTLIPHKKFQRCSTCFQALRALPSP